MLATILFTQVALDLTDEISNWVWAGTRDDAARALEAISQILAAGMPASHFLGIVDAIFGVVSGQPALLSALAVLVGRYES